MIPPPYPRPPLLAFIIELDLDDLRDLHSRLSTWRPGQPFDIESLWSEENWTFIRVTYQDQAPDRATWFDLSYSLGAHLKAQSCEPDIPTELPLPNAEVNESSVGGPCNSDNAVPANKKWVHDQIRLKIPPSPPINSTVVIAQPDTGITPHSELPASTIHPGARGFYAEENHTFYDPQSSGPLASPGHGTGTGSVIIASGNDQIAGTAPDARLMPLRCIKSVIRFEQSRVAQAVRYATESRCHIVSMSLGGLPSRALRAAVANAVRQNLIVLAAAGNCVGVVVYPGRYTECIAVAGCNIEDTPWCGSCFGEAVTITAPAEHVWRARPSPLGLVEPGEGTSFATAITAGIAARWVDRHGHRNLVKIANSFSVPLQSIFREALKRTARQKPMLPNGYGSGFLDASALLAIDPTVCAASAAERPEAASSLDDDVIRLISDVLKEEVLESVGAVGILPEFELELAALALDRARDSRNAIPPSDQLQEYVARLDAPRGARTLVELARSGK